MGNPKSILIVDDDVSLVGLVKFQLEAKGYRVLTAYDGVEGLDVLKAIVPPALIILDINMPKMNGIQFYQQILTSYNHPRYPVLVLTSRVEFEEIFKDVAAAGFVAKPFLVEKLIAEVERVVLTAVRPLVFLIDFSNDIHMKKIAEALVKEQYDVVGIQGPEQLRKLAELQKPRFVLLEFVQGNIAGEALMKKIRDYPLLHDVPVIAYSYSGNADALQTSLQAGAVKYLAAPVHYEEFIKALSAIELNQKG